MERLPKNSSAHSASKDAGFFKKEKGGDFFGDRLGRGESLQGGTKSKMETAFGTDFSDVEVHHDAGAASASGEMNARAFTYGKHIAFNTGEYEPGTMGGDALIAHELAHVSQQRNGQAAGVQQKGPQGDDDVLESEADQAAEQAVMQTYAGGKEADKKPVQMKSGLRVQRCAAGQKKPTTPAPGKAAADMKLIRRFRSEKFEQRESQMGNAGGLLAKVSEWADAEKGRQHMPESIGVVDLDPQQMKNAVQALSILKSNRSAFDLAGAPAVMTKMQEATKNAKGVKKYIGQADPEFRLNLQKGLIDAGNSLDEAEASLEKLKDAIDGYPLYQDMEKARDMLEKVKEGKVDQSDGIDAFADQLKIIRQQLFQAQTEGSSRPAQIDRIAFVLQYFIALNNKDHKGDPSADEMKKFKGTLAGSLSEDLHNVLGQSGNYALFIRFADMLDKQLAVRESMAKAGVSAGMIPSQQEIGSYFKSLAGKSNDEVIKAYQDYAQGFFFHRIVTNLDDMKLSNIDEIFTRKPSVAGARPLVCSGYAILGAGLISRAGGKVEQFINAVRATDDDILNDTLQTGHSLAQIKRGGKRFFVSNDIIVGTEEEGLSPLDNKGKMFTATGPTQQTSLQNLARQLGDKKEKLQKVKKK